MRLGATLAALCGLFTFPLLADFSYQQTSTVTGGSILKMMRMIPGGGKMREPQVSTHLLQGNRMATVSANSIMIIDLDRELMTNVDLEKKTYSTITFAEFRQAMDAFARKMGQQDAAPAIDFRVDVQNTGETRSIQGLNTSLTKMLLAMDMKDQSKGQTATMNMDMDMWMAKDVPGYEEVRRFMQKYAEKVGMTPEMMRMSRMAVGQKGTSEGMAKLMKESAKLQGVPIVTVTRMKGMGGPGGPAEQGGGAPPEVRTPSGKEVGDAAATSAVSSALGRVPGMGGLGGRLGGFGRKKKEEPKEEPKPETPPPPPAPAQSAAPQESVFMEMTSESSGFSTAGVDSSKFSVPAGFKEVEHEMKKALREAK